MIAQCQHCGAPLNVSPSSVTVRCSYCDKVNRVKKMATVLPQTPPAWQPPPVWTPPPRYNIARPELPLHTPSRAGPLLIVGLISLAVVFTTGIVVMVLLIGAPRSITVTTASPPSPPSLPIVSPVTAETTRGVSVASGDRTLCTSGNKRIANQKIGTVIASGTCAITLAGCTVTGNPAIIATDQARVLVLSGSSIEPSGPVAVIANGNAVVELKSGAKLNGQVVEQGNGKVIR